MKHRIWISAYILFTLSVYGYAQELRVISSDTRGITVEYIPDIESSQIEWNGVTYTKYTIDHAGYFESAPGDPVLPYRNELLALPGLTGATVTVLQADYTDEQNVLLVPNERYDTDPSTQETEMILEQGDAYRRAGWYPEKNSRIVRTGIARNTITGVLALCPIQWDAVRKVARIYSRLVVRVAYGPADPLVRVAGKDTRMLSLPVLNRNMVSNWVYTSAAPLKKSSSVSLADGPWHTFSVNEAGMYRLDRSWFASSGIDVSNIDPRTIKIYNNGGRELSTAPNSDAMEGFTEIAITMVGEEDGSFDDGDYVLFYGKDMTGWVYDTAKSEYQHYIHRFGTVNNYMFTYGGTQGKRIEAVASLNASEPLRPDYFTELTFVEEEMVNILQSGKLWLSSKLTPGLGGGGDTRTYTQKLEGYVQGQPVKYRLSLYSRSDYGTSNYFTVSDNGIALGSITMGTVDFGTDAGDAAAASGVRRYERTINYPDDRSVFTIVYSASDPASNLGGFIDWVEWQYPRSFVAVNDILAFHAPVGDSPVEYTLNGFSMSDISVYDITDCANVRRISGAGISGGTVRFQAESSVITPPLYYAVASTAYKTPSAATSVASNTLQSTSMQADFVIITAESFTDVARTLKSYREQPGSDYLKTEIVTIPAIYDAFNCGTPDPTAIRNFLKYTVEHWQTAPMYVLLLGDGHYDYKGIVTSEPNVVPTWQSESSVNLLGTYPTDDYYVQVVGNDDVVDMVCGRIPAETPEEAAAVIEKTIAYDTQSDFGQWRNRITFVADDHIATKSNMETEHTTTSETMATRDVPEGMEVKKIYAVSYDTENTAQGRRKPDVNQAIIDQMNEGTIAMTYTGHGGAAVWAHESILTSDVSIPQMKNANRLTFLSAATCTFGLYDTPGLKSGTELMILKTDGGTIGSLTSPRVVISSDNAAYTRAFHQFMFLQGREADGRAKRMGDAQYMTKQQYNSRGAFEKFHLFGDPTQRLKLPQHIVLIDSILVNGRQVQTDTVQLKALSKVTFEASVYDADSSRINDFNGTALVSLYDSEIDVAVPDFSATYSYKTLGGLLYRGEATIENGHFAVTFIMPKDISYQNAPGRVMFYIDNNALDGAGYSKEFIVGGSDTTTTEDNTGPEIALFMDSRRFVSGDVVNENSTLLADLYDANGINTTGLGIGHNLEIWLNNNDESIIVNDYYSGEQDSYQKGVVSYPFKDLPEGRNTLSMRVWDIFNNSQTAHIDFEVVSSAALSLANVYNVPNPMDDQTMFTFQYNRSDVIDAEVKIYTVAGRLIQTLEQKNISDRFVRIPWDGRDHDGDILANGVYFYKVIIRSLEGGDGSEAIGKLTVLR